MAFGGGNAVHLDSGLAATLSSDDGLLSEMGIAVRLLHTHDVLGFDVSGSVKLSSGMSNQSKVTVDNVEIGELRINHAANIVVLFNASATPDLVEKLIRALTYANTGGPLASAVVIDIYVQDVGARVADVSVTVDAPLVLTAGTDVITGGAGDDIFRTTAANLNASDQLDGAGGAGDTLELLGGGTFNLSPLAKFEKIETILGSTGDDVIMIDKSQLADLRVIDGQGTTAIGDDKLQLTGVAIDFTATSVVGIDIIELVTDGANITVDDKIIAKHITGFAAGENELILAHGNLSATERDEIHRNGIEIVTAGGITTTHHGPKLDNFAGDVVTAQQVGTIFIDAGRDSIFTCTDSRLDMLDLAVTSAFDARDTLGIDTSGNVSLIGGYAANSKVLVNGTEIGTLQTATNSIVHIQFNDNATGALVQELIHALTYTRNVGSTNGALTVDLHILDDLAFQAAGIITIDPPPTFHVLTAGNDAIAGGGYQDIFQTTAANLNAGDQLDGAGGTNDTVELIGGGTFDFSTLAKFDKIEAILGSGADDVIVLRALQIGSDIADIDGGGGNDTLQLVASGFNYDLRRTHEIHRRRDDPRLRGR